MRPAFLILAQYLQYFVNKYSRCSFNTRLCAEVKRNAHWLRTPVFVLFVWLHFNPHLKTRVNVFLLTQQHQKNARKLFPTCVLRRCVSVSAVLAVLVAVRVAVRVLGLGAVGRRAAHSAHVKLVVGGVVRPLCVRLARVVVMVALVCRVVAHVRGRGLGQSRRVLGSRMAAHRAGEISRNTG